MEPTSRKKLRKCGRQETEPEDPFNRLPEELISSQILSRFTLEEGARYRILSHQWNKLWSRGIGPKLIFAPWSHFAGDEHPPSLTRLYPEAVARVNRLRPCFERWITCVLQAYCGPKLDEFIVRFPFYDDSRDSIDSWVESALRKGVTRLEFDFSTWDNGRSGRCQHEFKFPQSCATTTGLLLCNNLADVCLDSVAISGKKIESLVANCPLLERLCIRNTDIGMVVISGESIRLKSLELMRCDGDIKISASSLVSLKFHCPKLSLFLEHVPHLSVFSIGGGKAATTYLRRGLKQFSFFTRLKTLKLVLSPENVCQTMMFYPLEFPQLEIEELKVRMNSWDSPCLLWPILLIKASPLLRKFSVQIFPGASGFVEDVLPELTEGHLTTIRNAATIVQRHKCLKLVEFHDFGGEPRELELIRHLLTISADSLEQFVVLPSKQVYGSSARVEPRMRANTLSHLLPPDSTANIIVL